MRRQMSFARTISQDNVLLTLHSVRCTLCIVHSGFIMQVNDVTQNTRSTAIKTIYVIFSSVLFSHHQNIRAHTYYTLFHLLCTLMLNPRYFIRNYMVMAETFWNICEWRLKCFFIFACVCVHWRFVIRTNQCCVVADHKGSADVWHSTVYTCESPSQKYASQRLQIAEIPKAKSILYLAFCEMPVLAFATHSSPSQKICDGIFAQTSNYSHCHYWGRIFLSLSFSSFPSIFHRCVFFHVKCDSMALYRADTSMISIIHIYIHFYFTSSNGSCRENVAGRDLGFGYHFDTDNSPICTAFHPVK